MLKSSFVMGALIVASAACSDSAEETNGSGGNTNSGTGGTSATTGTGAGSADCANIQGEGFAVGQIAANWTLSDQTGASVNLHDYCGKVIYLESGAEW